MRGKKAKTKTTRSTRSPLRVRLVTTQTPLLAAFSRSFARTWARGLARAYAERALGPADLLRRRPRRAVTVVAGAEDADDGARDAP